MVVLKIFFCWLLVTPIFLGHKIVMLSLSDKSIQLFRLITKPMNVMLRLIYKLFINQVFLESGFYLLLIWISRPPLHDLRKKRPLLPPKIWVSNLRFILIFRLILIICRQLVHQFFDGLHHHVKFSICTRL